MLFGRMLKLYLPHTQALRKWGKLLPSGKKRQGLKHSDALRQTKCNLLTARSLVRGYIKDIERFFT